jgi:hypothetical protein
MGVTVAMGALKLVLAFAGDRVRRLVPRAALRGSIAGVAILLVAFLPALKVFADPLVGVTSLTIIDGRLGRAAAVFTACAAATLFGLIHSPLPSGALFWPWSTGGRGALTLAAAYGVGAGLLLTLAHAQSRTRGER